MSNKFFIHVDPSTDAVNSAPGSSYSVDFSNCIINLDQGMIIKKVTPRVFSCSNSWFPIAANNVLNFIDIGSTVRAAPVAIADYSAQETALAAAVQAAMVATGATGTPVCTYSSATNTFTIGSSAAFQVKFSQNPVLASMLGFKPVDLSGASSYTSTITPNITGPSYLMLISNSLGHSKTIFRRHINAVLLRIPVNVSHGSTISFPVDYCADIYHGENGKNIAAMDFKLVYPNGTPVNLNGIPWSLSMEIKTVCR